MNAKERECKSAFFCFMEDMDRGRQGVFSGILILTCPLTSGKVIGLPDEALLLALSVERDGAWQVTKS